MHSRLLVGLASTAIVLGTAALAVAVIPAAAPVVAGTLLVTGALAIVSAAVSVIRDHSADNVGYNLGAFTGSAVIGASTGTTFSEMLSPAKYAPPDQIPPLVQSTLANAWTDQQGNISPLAFLNDWMFGNPVPGEPNPMETGPDTWAAIGTLTGNGTGAADALNWLFYTPCP